MQLFPSGDRHWTPVGPHHTLTHKPQTSAAVTKLRERLENKRRFKTMVKPFNRVYSHDNTNM